MTDDPEEIRDTMKKTFPRPKVAVVGGHVTEEVGKEIQALLGDLHTIMVPQGAVKDPDRGIRWIATFLRSSLDEIFPNAASSTDEDSDVPTGDWRLRKERKWTDD